MKSAIPIRFQHQAFALVVTVSLLVLLSVIALGFLSLSVVTLRSSSHDQAQVEARANARLALQIAIGELQKQLGPDQRISANGAILDDPGTSASEVPNPHWTGVWDSWKANDGISAHNTINPPANPGNGVMAPTYLKGRNDYFRSWLLSLNPDEAANMSTPLGPMLEGESSPGDDDDAVMLVGEGSVGPADPDPAIPSSFVSARLLDVQSTSTNSGFRGRYAWWVGDESQKARIMDDSYQTSAAALTSAEKIFRQQSPASTGTKTVPGLEGLQNDSQLAAIPSLQTLDLVTGVAGRPAQRNFHHITPYSYQVFSDVREGGLKRDLSTLLERPIDPNETSNEFMLYKFNTKDTWANIPTLPNTPQECVPIQDLAAFYQLYDNDPNFSRGRRGGVQYTSGSLTNTIQVNTPDYGTIANTTTGTLATYATKFQREYTTLYRNPIPIKVQFLLAFVTEDITATDRANPVNISIPATDELKLRIAVFPAVTMWNPYNVPIVMQSGVDGDLSQQLTLKSPAFAIRIDKRRSGASVYMSRMNMVYAHFGGLAGGNAERRCDLMRLNFARQEDVRFEPGEVKIFSMPTTTPLMMYPRMNNLGNGLTEPKNMIDASPGWNPSGYFTFRYSANAPPTNSVHVITDVTGGLTRHSISLNPSDQLALTLVEESKVHTAEDVSRAVSPIGAALCFYMAPRSYAANTYSYLNMRHLGLVSRFGGLYTSINPNPGIPFVFNKELMRLGSPGGIIPFSLGPILASSIKSATASGETYPFLQMAIMAGCETGELQNGGLAAGRKFPSRPFLHSSPLQSNVIDEVMDKRAPYNHGWNWWIEDMNSILEALVQESKNGKGYYGGGYTPESGATQVIQQEIPVTPPLSIAALSHARLGGFTLASEAPVGQGNTGAGQAEGRTAAGWIDDPSPNLGFQRVTATGQAGLHPHVLQAIGNSYANPILNSNVAYNSSWQRFYDQDAGSRSVTFADHSYLANKALWDEFFFSSLTPQRSAVEVFGGGEKSVAQVANDFFMADTSIPLNNRRIIPYTANMDQNKLDSLLSEIGTYNNGMGDKIAAHLMAEGAFNINSTSTVAWKTLFSSLRGKPVAYLAGGKTLQESTTTGNPVGFGSLPNSQPIPITDPIQGPNTPPEQWQGWRELTDEQIDQLATAMVKQVKLRGPFLSMSEFVNRRLDSANPALSVKGALQAALDDENVSINANFRTSERKLDSEISGIPFAFPDAAKGPIAYGSAAYVDQADVLRNFAEQLTPRGDTFVIRTYGDALDANGKVTARAWCEAVVQRVPDYVNSQDDPHLKQADSTLSESSKRFGRKFQIVSFRWLNSTEV